MMMKKVLPLMAAFALSLSLSASAEIWTETREGHDFIMSYPVVRLENKKAAERINEDIEDLLVRIRDNYENEQIQKGTGVSFEVMYEDDELLSIILTNYIYSGGPYGRPEIYGLVYDKAAGTRLPLESFLRITEDDLDSLYELPKYSLYTREPTGTWEYQKRLSTEYFLLEDRSIGLLYNPGELDAFAAGPAFIHVSQEKISEYNEKN